MMHDPLANILSQINNGEKIGREECIVRPASKFVLDILKIMKEKGYIKDFKIIEDGKGNMISVKLLGKINNCNVIKPRFYIKISEFEKFEKRFLPAEDFGYLILSTSKGFMTHADAKKKGFGGRLVAYFY